MLRPESEFVDEPLVNAYWAPALAGHRHKKLSLFQHLVALGRCRVARAATAREELGLFFVQKQWWEAAAVDRRPPLSQ